MKKFKFSFILVLLSLLLPLVTLRADDSGGFWKEGGAAKKAQEFPLTFGDWEYFYHEPFTTRREIANFSYQDSVNFPGVQFTSDGQVFAEESVYAIDGKGLKLENNKSLTITFDGYGLGGFSFEYKSFSNNENAKIIVTADTDGGQETEAIIKTISNINESFDEVIYFRDDYNIADVEHGEPKVKAIVTIKVEGLDDGEAVTIDNVKWSNHNIKVTYRNSIGDLDKFTHENVRYGRVASGPEEKYLDPESKHAFRPGYNLFGWYDNSALNGEPFDFENTPIREDITLYAKWEIVYYTIEYELFDGYFEPFLDREDMVRTFLEDLYNWIDEQGMLTETDFHNFLKSEGLAGDEITLEDFIDGPANIDKELQHSTGPFNGLFNKGYDFDAGGEYQSNKIEYHLNGGYFEYVGGQDYTTGQRDVQLEHFLTDFYNYLKNIRGMNLPFDAQEFIHGKGKSSGFDGYYDDSSYFLHLFEPHQKGIDEASGKFINYPAYNKWVALFDEMDKYVKAVNNKQSFWGSRWEAAFRIKHYMQRYDYNIQATKKYLTNSVAGIKYGEEPLDVPSRYFAGRQEFNLPIPKRSNHVFDGWIEYDYLDGNNGQWVQENGQIKKYNEITLEDFGHKHFYATWRGQGLPKVEEVELGKALRPDSYFRMIFDPSETFLENGFSPNLDYSDLEPKLAIGYTDESGKGYFINDPRYNKWRFLLDLVHDYTMFGNEIQAWHGIYKSPYTAAIRMEMFLDMHNPWAGSQNPEAQYVLYEMTKRVPYQIPKTIVLTTYTVEDEIILPKPVKEYSGGARWHQEEDFSDKPVTKIEKGSVGNKKFYALYDNEKFEITYNLNKNEGEKFAYYTDRNEMIDDFLYDFYHFVKDTVNRIYPDDKYKFTDSLEKFKHGSASSGYNGTYKDFVYFGEEVGTTPIQLLYMNKDNVDVDNRAVLNESLKFINQEIFNRRWLPLLDDVALFTKAVKSTDDFWLNPNIASERLYNYFSGHRPAAESNIEDFYSNIPNVEKGRIPYFHISGEGLTTKLPVPVKDKHRFRGWYVGNDKTTLITEIDGLVTQDLELNADWTASEFDVVYDFGDYGYHSSNRSELFYSFIEDYINLFNLQGKTVEQLYNDFYENSEMFESEQLKFSAIFKANVNRWKWLEDYIFKYVDEEDKVNFIDNEGNYNQELWRLNIDALLNSGIKEVVIDEVTYSSVDFSNFITANSFWKYTSYNKYTTDLIAGSDVLSEEFINKWHPEVSFMGWYDNNDNKVTKLPEYPTEALHLFAKWQRSDDYNKIIFTYVDHDDTIIKTITISEDELNGLTIEDYLNNIVPEDPTREHYEFIRWDKDLDDLKTLKVSTTIKALYTPNSYTLTFVTDGGTVIADQILTYPEHPERPVDPTNDGYIFVDWYKDEDFNDEFSFAAPLYSDTTVYAKWDAIQYTITYFNIEEDEFLNKEFNPDTYTILDEIVLGIGVRENHRFDGWYLEDTFENKIDVIEGRYGNLNLYPKFTLNEYIVLFDSNGGTEVISQRVEHGDKLSNVTSTRVGYDLVGWYIGSIKWDFDNHLVTEEMTLVAKWELSKYTVTYYYENNEVLETHVDVTHGSYIVVPEVPVKHGYIGIWDKNLVNYPIHDDYNVYPVYDAITYDITYYLDGGVNDDDNPSTYTPEESVIFKDATKLGYEFIGWYNNAEFTGAKVTEIAEGSHGNISLYANWKIETYTISYKNLNGATHTNIEEYTVLTQYIFKDPTSRINDGYTFVGWCDNNDNKVSEIEKGTTNNITLYAIWEEIEYTITYKNLNGSTNHVDNPDTYKVTTETITLKDPTVPTGYKFLGWFTHLENGSKVEVIEKGSTGDITLYARFEALSYTVTFKYINESDNVQTSTKSVKYNHTVIPEDIPNRAHYNHIGWTIEGEDTLFNFDTPIKEDITLVAVYDGYTYYLTFNLNGGTFDSSITNPQAVKYDNKPVEPIEPNKVGYTFAGWYSSLEYIDEFNFDVSLDDNKTIYAKWEAIEYTIIYHLEEGATHSNDETYTVDKPLILLDATKEGYLFEGWYLEETYNNKITVIENMIGEINLYGKFSEAIDYNITYILYLKEPNDPITFNPIKVTYNTVDGLDVIEVPIERESSTFGGWYLTEDFIGEPITNIPKGSTGDITLYAKWDIKKYSIKFYSSNDFNNKLDLDMNDIEHSSLITLPEVPVDLIPTGFEFIGWHYIKDNNVVLFESDKQVNDNYELYPEFTLKQHKVTFHYPGKQEVLYVYHGNNLISFPEDPISGDLVFDYWRTYDGAPFDLSIEIKRDYDLVPTWVGHSEHYLVIFNLNNGEPSVINYVSKDTPLGSVPTDKAVKEGYNLIGWMHDGEFKNVILEIVINEDTVFDAVYEINKYEVTFVDHNSDVIETQTVDHGSDAVAPVAPIRVGYTFTGWDKEFNNVTEDLIVKALYEKTVYQVTFKDGNNIKDVVDVTHGTPVLRPVDPTKDHYVFAGWLLGEDLYDFNNLVTSNITLVALWELKDYTITYENLYGIDHNNISTYTIDTQYIFNNPEARTGYEFMGWYDNSSYSGNKVTVISKGTNGDMTLYAKWSSDDFTISYNLNGGNFIDGFTYPTSYNLDNRDQISIPEATRVGYTFTGWYINNTNDKVENLEDRVGNLALNARWDINVYEITYLGLPSTANNNNPTTYTYGLTITLVNPTNIPEGVMFVGWYTDEVRGNEVISVTNTNITVYARFKSFSYIVTFKYLDNNGQEKTSTIPASYDSLISKPEIIIRDHYKYIGFSTNGSIWDFEVDKVKGNITLTAVYEANVYTLTFDSNDGDNTPLAQVLTYPNRTFEPDEPTKESCEFLGWFIDEKLTVKFIFNKALEEDITVYAKWTIKEYSVKFVDHDGSTIEIVSVGHGSDAVAPEDPTRENYEFIGWNNEFTNVTSDLVIKALYKAKEHTITYVFTNKDNVVIMVPHGSKIEVDIPVPESKLGNTVKWDEDLHNKVINGDYTIKAVYELINYTITYSNLISGVTNSNPQTYTIEDEFNLVSPDNIPIQEEFMGWYLTSNFEGDPVTQISLGTTEDITLYAKWKLATYTINYVGVNNDDFKGVYEQGQREQMMIDFLTDFHEFLGKPGSLNDFMHGDSKTSGFDGKYNELATFEKLFELGSIAVSDSSTKFVNQVKYNKWGPLLLLMDEYTTVGNPAQAGQFLGSYWTGSMRIKPFVKGETMWSNDYESNPEKKILIDEILARIPEQLLREEIYYEYDFNTPTITLPVPHRTNQEFLGWYTSETGGTKVTTIPKHSTGNKTFYARWGIEIYDIVYDLQGGIFDGYLYKDEMINGFMQDFYDFVKPNETYQQFVHGSGNYNGAWHSVYSSRIFGISIKTNDNNYFLSHSSYQAKWKPFADMMEKFVKVGNPDQDFWSSPYTGTLRMKQYFMNVKPGAAWSNSDMAMMPSPRVPVLPQTTYTKGDKIIILPTPIRSGYSFDGWFTSSTGGSRVYNLNTNTTGNKRFYARWTYVSSPGDIQQLIVTNGVIYKANLPLTDLQGIILFSPGAPRTPAASWYSKWNGDTNVTAHYAVDNTSIYQYLPTHIAGAHTRGPGNHHYISIMFAETGDYDYINGVLTHKGTYAYNKAIFDATWNKAVNLTAYVLKTHGINVVNEITLVGRHEAHKIKYDGVPLATLVTGSPEYLFNIFGKTMNDFRDEVRAKM